MKSQIASDETLMAYADGALDAEAASQVEAAAQADPDIARRIKVFQKTGDLLGEAGRARPLKPLPSELNARVLATLRASRSDEAPTPTVVPFWRGYPMAIAASLAFAVGLIGGLLLSQVGGVQEQNGPRAGFGTTPELARALATLPSGRRLSTDDGELVVISSFTTADGELCREFELARPNSETVVSVACRIEAGWQPRFSVMASGPSGSSYAPASAFETLDVFLSVIGAEMPLSPEEEEAALSRAPD